MWSSYPNGKVIPQGWLMRAGHCTIPAGVMLQSWSVFGGFDGFLFGVAGIVLRHGDLGMAEQGLRVFDPKGITNHCSGQMT